MSWTVRYTRVAAKAIRKLDPLTQKRVRAAIELLVYEPYRGKSLHLNLQGLRSWRTGDWRIIYRVEEHQVEILVVAVGHRREVYDRIHERLK